MNELNFDNVNWDTVGDEPDIVEDIDLGADSLSTTVKPATVQQALQVNPTQYAENMKISRDAGIPVDAVEGDPTGVSTDLKLKKINFDEMSKRAPGTSQFLSDYSNAVIAQDDIDVMQIVEDTLRSIPAGFVEGGGMAVEGGGRFIEAGGRMVRRGLDMIVPDVVTDSVPDSLKELDRLLAPATLLRRQGDLLKSQAVDIADVPVERENVATDIAKGLGQVVGQIALSLVNPNAAVGAMFAQGVDQQGERQEASGTEGESVTSDMALFAGGGVTAVSEKIGLDALLNRVPPKIKNKILRQITDVSLAGGIEAVQEVVEGVAQGVLEQMTTNPDAEIFEGLDREAIAAGGTGAIVRGIVNMLTPGRVRDADQHEAAEQTKTQLESTTLEKLNTDISGMKMKQYDTETLKKFIEAADADNGTTVFVDAVQAALYLREQSADDIKNDKGLQHLQNHVNSAAAIGGDVEIPISDFAVNFAGTEHFDNLKDYMSLNADTMSPFRAEQSKEETKNYVQSLVADANENVSQYVESQDIYESVKQQLIDSGQVTVQNAGVMAEVVPAWATVYARKNGISVKEAYERSGLVIEGPQTGERARLEGELALLNQPEVQQMLDMDEESFIQAVNPEGKVIADDDIVKLNIGDLDLPETTTPVSSFNGIDIVSDTDGNMYAVSDEGVLGMVGPAEDNETMIDLVSEAKGKGVGKELAKAYLRQNPMAAAGGFTKAGEATYRAAFRELKAERDQMLKQSQVLPDRFAIIDAVKGRTPIEDVIETASGLVGKVKDIYTTDISEFSENMQAGINSIDNVSVIHSTRPDKIATVWDESGKVYRVINGKVSEVSTEQDPNSDLSPSQGLTLNILSNVFRDARNTDPKEIEAQRIREIRATETRRRQNRLKSIPEMPADFDQALQQLADWSENLEEFKKALNPDMFDISDRNLTRLGRATMSLDPEFEVAGDEGEVTIFRALPEGEEIEAGDWVSFDEGYAAGHETNVGEEGGVTVSIEVPADEVYHPGADENEWVYIPKNTWGDIESIDELWQSLTDGSKPDTYPEVEGATELPELPESQTFRQDGKNLFVAHNLSAENLIAANELGGLAAPSLAVARSDISDFSGFGEITLLANPSLLEDSKARTFDADVYTPRQPRATYNINQKKYNTWREGIEAVTEGLNLSLPAYESLAEQSGADNLLRSDSVKYKWLKEQGKEPKLKNRKVESTIKQGAKFEGQRFMLRDDPKFIKLAGKHYRNKINDIIEKSAERAERFEDMYFNEDGTVKSSKIDDFAQEVVSYRASGGKDLNQLRYDISDKFRNEKLRKQYEADVTEDFNAMVDGKTLFKGFTNAGNRKYTEYNMVNVVREMTQSLQGGETSFYGAPSVRSAYANEMKTIAQVQARRDQIIPEGDLAEMKEDATSIFENALEDLKPFYKFDADSWGYAEDAGTAIMEGPKGIREVFNVTPEVKKIIDDLTEYLSSLPSTYFETKIQRAVDFSEFNTAVVPSNIDKKALKILQDAGLKIKKYNPKVEGARADVIAKQKKLLFQNDDKGTRGYYDPANSMIRLTEAADLSTFLHEFAHFMYEMELKADGDTMQSIHNWFKRNAEDVAKEANGYYKRDAVGDLAQPAYHGTPHKFDRFSLDAMGSGEGAQAYGWGMYFAGKKEVAEWYRDKLNDDLLMKSDGTVFDPSSLDNPNVRSLLRRTGDIDEALNKINQLKESLDPETQGYQFAVLDETVLTEIKNNGGIAKNTGQLYQVELPEDSELLDYDAPLDDQPFTNIIREITDNHHGEGTFDSYVENSEGGSFREWSDNLMEDFSDQEISMLLNDKGIKGLRYKDADSRINSADGDTRNYVIWDEQAVTIESVNEEQREAELLAQSPELPGFNAGSITPGDVTNFIDNKTTGDQGKDLAIRRAVHEQFARGFETYLMEGKAPSVELRNAFRTFARWLTQIYKAIRGQLNVNLDDEMRKVFDAMLATEEQIEAAEMRMKYRAMINTEDMSEEDAVKLNKQNEKVKDKQTETLRDKLIAEITRTTKKWWNDEKSDMIDEEIDTLKKEPVYRAREALSSPDLKLDHATVKDMMGFQRTDKRGRTSTRIPNELVGLTAKGQAGVHPDEAAAVLGYASGSELLLDLTTAPPIQDVAEQNAEARMLEKYGDIMNDGTIQKEADEAVQNEERGKLLLEELKILRRNVNQPTLERQVIKQVAEETIAKLPYNKIFVGKYRKAEIKAAQESAAAQAKGDMQAAANAKARQVMNYYLGMQATEARNATDKIVTNMARYNKKKVREEIMKADGGFMEQIDKILARFEFRKSASIKSVDAKNVDINSWLANRIDKEGDALVITNAVLNELYQTHWKKVPFEELKGIYDSVRNMEHVARYANKINRLGEKVDFKKLVNEWTDHMNVVQPDKFKSQRTDVIEGRNWGRWAMGQMTKIPFLASWLDGGERAGMSHDILVQPFTDAYDTELKLWGEVGKPVMDLIENRSKEDIKRHNTKVFIPEIKTGQHDGNLYVHQIIAVALNTGNEGNLRKLLLGEGWADPDDEGSINIQNPQLQAVLSRLNKSDWEMVQKIWDQMELLYPQLAEVHRKTTGLVPPKVDAIPVPTPYGTFNGGYYPVKYDRNRSLQALENEDKLNAQTESMFGGTMSIQASVTAGATNERTGYYGPIRLSLDVVPSHFQETIHYITHHDAVRQVNKLIRNEKVAETITAKLGPEEYAQLKPWLNDIAKDGREAPTKTFWGDMLQRLRFGMTLGVMGFKASTGIIQISGLSNTVAEVGMKHVYQAARSILGSPENIKSAWDFAVANSKVMNHRADTMDREIKNALKRIEGKRGALAVAQEMSMKHIALIQTYMVDLPSWHAAYMKSLDEFGDEQRAYRYADWVVENVQGSGVTKDMAQIMRGQSEEGRMFTMFMTFFSSLWNLERDLVKGAKSGRYSVTSVGAKAMFLFSIPVLFEMMMRGEFGGDDEPEEQLQEVLTKTAMFPLQSVPFVRDLVNGVGGGYGYNISPIASLIEQGLQATPKVAEALVTDEEITGSQAKGASKFIGAAFGIPGTGQAWATGEHLYEVIEEGEDFTVHQLLFGPAKE